MRTVSKKYANSSKYYSVIYIDDTNFFLTETIAELISFRLFAIAQLSIVNNWKNILLSGTGALDLVLVQ